MNELQSAVERLRKLMDGVEWIAVYAGLPVGQAHADLVAAKDSYLAEHPADDGVALDEDWLRSVCG